MSSRRLVSLPILVLAIGLSDHARAEASAAVSAETGSAPIEEIRVVGERIVGRVDTPRSPILELDEVDIAGYGAGSLEELVEILAIETGSARGRGTGRRAFLVNGARISSFRELRSFPPEAVSRIEVLPEEVALQYGFAADQRVINFILKERFASREIELDYRRPGEGGFAARKLEATLLNIAGDDRYNFNAEVGDRSTLTEAERNVTLAPGDTPEIAGDADPTAFRSLVDDSAEFELSANYARALGGSGASLTLSATAERTDSVTLAGLDTLRLLAPDGASALRSIDDRVLARRARVDTLAFGSTLNAWAGAWQVTGTVDASRVRRDTEIDRNADASELLAAAAAGTLAIDGALAPLADPGFDAARSTQDAASALVTATTQPFVLPAGEVSLTLDAGLDYTRIDSRDTRNPGREAGFERRDLSIGLDLGLPLIDGDQGVVPVSRIPFPGDVALNLSAGVRDLSDFGTLTDWTVGLTWDATEFLELQLTHIVRQAAPSLAQLGEPEVVDLGTPIFDFATGDTALVRVINGGNPDLAAERQRDLRIAALLDLPIVDRSKLLLEYNRNRAEDVSAGFPLLTPAIEFAFPDRVTRSATGRLLSVDARPITLAEQTSSRLRLGLQLSGKVGTPAGTSEEPPRGEGRGSGSGRRSIGPGRRGDDGVGRWRLSVAHTIELDSEVLIAAGGPRLDLLDGDALSGSGVSRHAVSLEGGIFRQGYGLRVSGSYESASDVDGSGLPGSSDLEFGSLATLDLRFFVDLGRREGLVGKGLVGRSSLFENARVSLRIDNVFDARRRVTDESGKVPLRFQRYRIDPVGRFLRLEFRKLF